MYDEALLKIEDQSEDYQQLAQQILEWIVFAVRPLSVNELQEALAVEEGNREIDESNFVDPELFTSVCAGLVFHDQASSVICLVHFSAQEYFKRIRFTRFPTAQIKIGRTCLTYLSFQEFASGACSNDRAAWSRIRKHHLLHYAAEHWGDHGRGDSEREMKGLIFDFLNDKEKLSSAVQVLHFGGSTRFPRSMSRLHLTAHFGLENTVTTLLEQGENISARDDFGATALHRAAEAGQENVVQLLLEHGADIEAGDVQGHTAIHRATVGGRTETVQLLLKRGASVSKAIDGRSALHFAAEFGNEAITMALLEAGGKVNTETYNVGDDNWQKKFFAGRTPLHWAAQNGHLAIAQMLLKRGAKVNALNSTYRTPLQEAIMFRHTPMIKYLLENGASLTIKDGYGWTPLHKAAWQSPPQITEMLVNHGAEIDPINIDTPLDAKLPGIEVASDEVGWRQIHLAEYIQLRGTNTPPPENVKPPEFRLNTGKVGCTPLHLAVARGESDIFELLKSHGADLEFRDSSGLVPLHRTVQATRKDGPLQIIESLIDTGVDIDIRDKRRLETTLQMAARLGRLDCVKYLLKRGADIGTTNRFGENALQLAEASGHGEIARVLIEHAMLHQVTC